MINNFCSQNRQLEWNVIAGSKWSLAYWYGHLWEWSTWALLSLLSVWMGNCNNMSISGDCHLDKTLNWGPWCYSWGDSVNFPLGLKEYNEIFKCTKIVFNTYAISTGLVVLCHIWYHHHLPVTYAVGVPTDLHKLLHSWRSWAEERRECMSIWVHSLMFDNQDFCGLPLFLRPSTVPWRIVFARLS